MDNYAHLLARRLGLGLDDVTFSGATTQDILTGTASGRRAQIDAVTGPTRLVTITCGGNDVGYATTPGPRTRGRTASASG